MLKRACKHPLLALNKLLAIVTQNCTRLAPLSYTYRKARRVYGEAFSRALDFLKYNQIEGDIAEFGSYHGFTARTIAEKARKCGWKGNLHLFDSFEGFPEIVASVDRECYEVSRLKVWNEDSFKAGDAVPYQIARVLSRILNRERVHIHQGYFEEVFLPHTLERKLILAHIDCDLYQSAKFVLEMLVQCDLLEDGAVLMFDDFNCGRANPAYGERRAFAEVFDASACSHFFNYGWHGAAFVFHKNMRSRD